MEIPVSSCLACLVAVASLSGCATLPDHGANAKSVHFEGMNRVRYIEIFVRGGDATSGDLRANVYNTPLVRGVDYRATKDSAPQRYSNYKP